MTGKTGLSAKIGPLGQLYDAPFQADLPVPARFEKVLDFVSGHGFAIYGLPAKTHIHASQFAAFGECARNAHLEVHYVSHLSHPLDSPPFQNGPLLHASAEVQARRLQNAQTAGMRSYTMHPPRGSACSLDQLEAEVGMIRDIAGHVATDLRISNGPSGEHLLSSLEELRDFCRRTGIQPTINAASDFLANGVARDTDNWSHVMAGLASETLFCYGNHRIRPGAPVRLTIYNDDSDASPPIRPLLQAAFERNLRPQVLVYGDRPEADALGVLRAQAAIEGVDLAELQGRLSHTRMHRRVATVASDPQ